MKVNWMQVGLQIEEKWGPWKWVRGFRLHSDAWSDCQDNFSGIIHDMTLMIWPINWTVRNLDVDQMDMETAFLEGILEENERVHLE